MIPESIKEYTTLGGLPIRDTIFIFTEDIIEF